MIISMDERSDTYRKALKAAQDESTDSLLERADAWGFVVVDQAIDEVERHLCSERLRAIKTELTRRETLSRVNSGVASPSERQYQAWRELAGAMRDRADMLRIFDLCGYHFTHRQGAKEAHAPCLVCGGTDRLVIKAGPPDFCWCRQCQWSGDVITVTRSLRQVGFRDAVAWLAGVYGGQIAA